MRFLAGIETLSLPSVRALLGIASDRAAVKRRSTHRMELTAQVKSRRIGIVKDAVRVMRFLPPSCAVPAQGREPFGRNPEAPARTREAHDARYETITSRS